jgi:hypothetical protein
MLQHIKIGKDNAITRSELCRLTGLSDRRMRRQIEELQFQGHRIINMSDGLGYYFPQTDAEFYRYTKQEYSRIFKELKKIRKMENAKSFAVTTE